MAMMQCFDCDRAVEVPHRCPINPKPEAILCLECKEIVDIPHNCKEKTTMPTNIKPIFITPAVDGPIKVPVSAFSYFTPKDAYYVLYDVSNECVYLLTLMMDGAYYMWVNLSFPFDEESYIGGKFDSIEEALFFPQKYNNENQHYDLMVFKDNVSMYKYIVEAGCLTDTVNEEVADD